MCHAGIPGGCKGTAGNKHASSGVVADVPPGRYVNVNQWVQSNRHAMLIAAKAPGVDDGGRTVPQVQAGTVIVIEAALVQHNL